MNPTSKSDKDDAVRSLRTALAEQASGSVPDQASARTPQDKPQDSTPAVDKLRGLLNGDSTPAYPVADRSDVQQGRTEQIKDVLADASANTAKAKSEKPANKQRANTGQAATSVSTVLKESLAGKHAGATPIRRPAPSAERDDSSEKSLELRELAHATDLQAATRNPASRAGQAVRWLALLVIVVVGALAWWSHRTKPVGQPPSELAAFVDKLGREIAEKGRKDGALPERLTGLPGLPPEAIEMPVEYYPARLQAPRLEVFYIRLSESEFALIGRYSDSAWMFSSGDTKPLRAVPAYSF